MGTDALKKELLKYRTPRVVVQFFSFISFSSIILNLGTLPLLLPVLWTWGLRLNTAGDAFTAMQLMFARYNLVQVVFPWLPIASFLLVGILFGKSLCGWVCPFGFVQDLVAKIKRRQTDLSKRNHNTMVYIKYLVLAITLFISVTYSASVLMGAGESYRGALGLFVDAPFTALSPSETLFATVPKLIQDFRFAVMERPLSEVLAGISIMPALFWIQFIIMLTALVFAVYVPRSWCRYFCPHGAIMAIMNRFSFLGLRREPFKCEKGGCRLCVQICPTRVPILESPWEKFSDPECNFCMKCADACPHKAIKLTYP